jgi:hypothetical protein
MKPDWNTIKLEYIGGKIGMRLLAQKHGVNFSTLSKRGRREDWAGMRARRALLVSTGARQEIDRQIADAGLTAAEFVKRTCLETGRWLDRIEALATGGHLDAVKLTRLIAAWRAATSAGREAFALDRPIMERQLTCPPVRVHIMTTPGIVSLDTVPVPAAFKPAKFIELEAETETPEQGNGAG